MTIDNLIRNFEEKIKTMINLFKPLKDDGFNLDNNTFIDSFFSIYGRRKENEERLIGICKQVMRSNSFTLNYLNIFIELGVPISMFKKSKSEYVIETYKSLTPSSFDVFSTYLSNICLNEFTAKQIRKTISLL